MQIVTDSGTDISLSKEEQQDLNIHVVPLNVSLDNVTYREGVDIQPAEFYPMLAKTEDMPTTSQPSAGEFADTYRKILEYDQDILSIHISSGLSGTYNSALAAAQMLPDANITVIDAKTLSAAAGWQVEAAARAVKKGLEIDEVKSLVERISAASDSIYTLNEMKYLIHGGRISHMKGLLASILNIKPMIGVEKVGGTYVQLGQVRTFKRAVQGLVNIISEQYPPGSALRVQVLHSFNFEGASMLKEQIDKTFDCTWLPDGHISLVLGAHTGPSMIGAAYALQEVFADL
ncbi:MAG TPA: DegV family protein [Anaerolineales bacterium]|jgi:DegV family protein with EDD domain|nr:DegV family protein [Anaerolineales bacterium]